MSSDPNFNPSQPAPKPRSNVLLWVLAIAAVFLVVCCGGVVIVGWKAKDFVANMATTNPAEVRQRTAEMIDMQIPAQFQPFQAMNLVAMQMVMYQTSPTPEGGSGMLMLMELNVPQPGMDAKQQEEELRKSMQQQHGNQDFEASKTERREIMIRGEPVPFEFSQGTRKGDAAEATVHTVSGVVRGKQGRPVMLQLTLPGDQFNEQEVIEMLQSIK